MVATHLILRRIVERGSNLLHLKKAMQAIAGLTKVSISTYHPKEPKGDMLKYQSSLPKLPVPPLHQSLEKYLKAVRPLVNDEEFKKTSKAVEEFGNGTGLQLQKALEERAKTQENWLADWWLYAAYLSYRESVVINSNPASIFVNSVINKESFIKSATRIIVGIAKFNLLVKSEKLQPEKTKAGPLCMSQYLNLYSCCRIPGKEVDTQRISLIEESRHIIVTHNDHFFSLELLSLLPDGTYALVPAQHIEEQLHKIVESSPTKAQHPVGVLTSEHRDTWYSARERLLSDPVNKATLDVIERAQYVMSLDPPHPGIDPNSPITPEELGIMSNRGLHGNGSTECSCNRWFDHAVQCFIAPDGYSGFNLEHSAADGTTALQITIYNISNMESEDFVNYKSPVPTEQLVPAQKLEWNISPESAEDIEAAKLRIDSMVAAIDYQAFVFEDFGKEYIKSCKLSPDSFVQVAIQLAYYKIYGHLAATYESAATRLFLLGRTDTIRACSAETLSFCKAMSDPTALNDEKVAKLKTAIEAHRKYTLEAVSGNAFDRHLLGLKIIAASTGIQLPSIFTDQTFAKCFHMSLSTSQVPVETTLLSGFGPVVPDGYGICYNPQEEKLLFTVSSFKKCHETDTKNFTTNLFEALHQMKKILEILSPIAKL